MPSSKNTGPTLSDITLVGRAGVKVVAIGIVVLMVGRTLLSAAISYWKATHPEPPPPPTMGFGALPPIAFPRQSSSDKPESYVLETKTGTLPNLGDRAKVFFMPKSSISLLADEEARKIAANIGYVYEPQKLNDRVYRWSKSQPLESVLELDIQTHVMGIGTNYLSRPDLLTAGNLPEGASAVESVKSLLSRATLLPSDMATVAGEITYLKSAGTTVIPAVSYSDADYVQVDLNRNPIDNRFRMYTPEGLIGTVTAIVSRGKESIVQLKMRYQPVDYSQVHTYPLRSTQSAWKLLQAGEGYIADKGKTSQAVIRQVELAYFDAFSEQEYLQPIYVFKGDGDFLGFISALDPQVYQTKTDSQ